MLSLPQTQELSTLRVVVKVCQAVNWYPSQFQVNNSKDFCMLLESLISGDQGIRSIRISDFQHDSLSGSSGGSTQSEMAMSSLSGL